MSHFYDYCGWGLEHDELEHEKFSPEQLVRRGWNAAIEAAANECREYVRFKAGKKKGLAVVAIDCAQAIEMLRARPGEERYHCPRCHRTETKEGA